MLGTDPLGRDMLARLMMAGRISLTVGFSAMLIARCVGTVDRRASPATMAASSARRSCASSTRCCAFPRSSCCWPWPPSSIPAPLSITLIIALTGWMEVARRRRGADPCLRDRDFAVAAELMGASDRYIMFRELLPNAVAPIVVAATLNVARAILLESYISLPRLRHSAADAELGQHAEQRAGISGHRALARDFSRAPRSPWR